MMKDHPRINVTCLCDAYDFPHRISGGKCNGSQWAESYYEMDKGECESCQSNNDGQCDVANGAETIWSCEGVFDHMRTQDDTRLPKSWDEYFELIAIRQKEEEEFYCDNF